MTKLDEMWVALAAYQPKADAEGHGESWRRMCSEKTCAATYAPALTSRIAVAAYAAMVSVGACADEYAQKAIDRIAKATGETE
jgi:hypothetical protein